MQYLYCAEKEKFTKDVKVQMLLDKIKHPKFKATVNAIPLNQQVNGISFTIAADLMVR